MYAEWYEKWEKEEVERRARRQRRKEAEQSQEEKAKEESRAMGWLTRQRESLEVGDYDSLARILWIRSLSNAIMSLR